MWIFSKLCAVCLLRMYGSSPTLWSQQESQNYFIELRTIATRIENNSDQRPRAREPNSVREIGKFVKSGFRCCYNTKMMRQITALLSVYKEFVTFQHCGDHLAGYSSASPEHMGKCNPSATRWLLQSTKSRNSSATYNKSCFSAQHSMHLHSVWKGEKRTENVNTATVCMRLARHSYKNRYRPTSTLSETTKIRYMQPNRKFQKLSNTLHDEVPLSMQRQRQPYHSPKP